MLLLTTVTIFKNSQAICFRNVKNYREFIFFVRPFVKGNYKILRETIIK